MVAVFTDTDQCHKQRYVWHCIVNNKKLSPICTKLKITNTKTVSFNALNSKNVTNIYTFLVQIFHQKHLHRSTLNYSKCKANRAQNKYCIKWTMPHSASISKLCKLHMLYLQFESWHLGDQFSVNNKHRCFKLFVCNSGTWQRHDTVTITQGNCL